MRIIKKCTVPLLLVLLAAFFCAAAPGFMSWNNLFSLLRQAAILGIVSTGMAMVMVTGGIDLSVGSLVSLVSCAVTIMINADVPPLAACIAGVLIAAAAMVLNGVVTIFTGMPAMLCTLAAMQIYQGLTYMITGAVPVYGLPDSMRMIGQGYLGFVPVPVVIMAAVFALGGVFLSRTYPGRWLYAVGSNAEAARLSGVPVVKTRLLACLICGLTVGLAAVVQMSRLFGGFPTAGSGLEMDVITAVVVGGVSFSGGKGNIPGVIQGVLLMGVLSNGLGVMGVGSQTQLVFKGVVLLVVVGLDCWQRGREKRAAKAHI